MSISFVIFNKNVAVVHYKKKFLFDFDDRLYDRRGLLSPIDNVSVLGPH